jgi:hypothetical protein
MIGWSTESRRGGAGQQLRDHPSLSIRHQGIYQYAAIVILALALGLRLIGLTKGIWVDEWSSIEISRGSGLFNTLVNLRSYDHPPLYFIMLHVWSQLGNSEAFLRLPSVLMGIGTVFVSMMWLRLYSNLASVLMGVLLGAAPMLLRYSQEIRDYPLLLLATSLAFLFATLVQRKPEKTSSYIGLGLSLTLAVATHLIAIFLVLPVFAFFCTTPVREKRILWSRVTASLAIPVGMFLFLYFLYLLNIDKSSDWWVPPVSPTTISLAGSGLFGLSMFPWPWAIERALIVVLPCFALALAFGNWRRAIPFLIAAFTYWLQIIGYSLFVRPILLDRALMPGLILLAGFVALQVASIKRNALRIALISVCVMLSLASALNWALEEAWEPVEPWKQMSSLLESQWQDNSLLVFYPDYCAGPVQYYFNRLRSAAALEIRLRMKQEEIERSIANRVEPLTKSPPKPHVFLVVRYDSDTSKDLKTLMNLLSSLKEKISRRFTLTFLSFGFEPSESSCKAMASVLGLPSHAQTLGSFLLSQYELTPGVSRSLSQP